MRYFRRRSLQFFILISITATLAGCSGDEPSTSSYDVRSYSLQGSIDWSTKTLTAKEDVTLVMSSPVNDGSVELDSRVNVSRVYSGDKTLSFSAENNKLRIDLSPLSPGNSPVTFTVEYTANASGSLVFSGPRDDDPVKSRIVYTDSEPDRASRWLVVRLAPSDRAVWSVELDVQSDEDVIANGRRVSDTLTNGGHRVKYELDKPIPAYLMAFAAGQIEHVERTTGRVPLGLWFRKGLKLDASQHFDVIADAMSSFEALIGPYPWDSYSVVLVPQFGGGMENATITFNTELSGQGNVDVGLNAHELAHHWFGDWVTMRTYNDVWVKEGMATLLASEAMRTSRDAENKGRLFGRDFSFDPGDAIVDEGLPPSAKYTSGPYSRAAWTLTQIRAKVGEQNFWTSLRKVLSAHALDSIDSESFIRSFSPALDEGSIQQLLGAIKTKQVPQISVARSNTSVGTNIGLTLSDPGKTLLVPLSVNVIASDGSVQTHELSDQGNLNIAIPDGGYLALDENDVHPDWFDSFGISEDDFSELSSLFQPMASSALVAFGTRSAAHQERALLYRGLENAHPSDFTSFYNSLDSTLAKRQAVFSACDILKTSGNESSWVSPLTPPLQTPAIQAFSFNYADCGIALPVQALKPELENLVNALPTNSLGRLEYLLSFDYGPATSLALIGKVATTAPSLDLRDQAIIRLSLQVSGYYSAIPANEKDAWKDFFRARLSEITSPNRFHSTWLAERLLNDIQALPIVAPLLNSVPLSAQVQRSTVCEAFTIAGTNASAWQAFQDAAQPWSTLASEAAAALANPSLCS